MDCVLGDLARVTGALCDEHVGRIAPGSQEKRSGLSGAGAGHVKAPARSGNWIDDDR
jgi:hypothetical protein